MVDTLRSSRRCVTFALLVCASVAVLAGCVPSDPLEAPISFSAPGGTMVVAVCPGGRVVEIELSERDLASDDPQWRRVWHATGDADLANNSLISIGSDVSGLEVELAETPTIRDEVEFLVQVRRGSTQVITAFFPKLEGADDLSTQWWQTTGEMSTEPCPSR